MMLSSGRLPHARLGAHLPAHMPERDGASSFQGMTVWGMCACAPPWLRPPRDRSESRAREVVLHTQLVCSMLWPQTYRGPHDRQTTLCPTTT